MLKPARVALVAAPLFALGQPALAAVIDFESAGDYTSNFRRLEREGAGVNEAQSANGAAKDYLRAAGGSNASRLTTVYDTTPVSAATRTTFGSGLTVEFDARIPHADRSVGIYLIDADSTGESAGYLALFNLDSTATTDRLRFASNANPSTGGAGTLGNEQTGNSGYNVSALDFVHFKLVYTINELNQPVLDFTVGDLQRTVTFATTAYDEVEVALRLSPYINAPNNYIDIDNFSAAVPEPSAIALLGLGSALILRGRRRG